MSKMSEHRRVSLTTISSSAASTSAAAAAAAVGGFLAPTATAAASLRFGSDFNAAQDSNKAPSSSKNSNRTIRLDLELFQTDSCSYPEFNYSKLLHLEKKKIKKLKQKSSNGFADPFEDNNDDEVARIAKELEQKYGSAYGSGRGRSKKDDHCDIGLGYDESDSFIDNTEAYDEVIPEEVETLEGGFYINCGALEFKKLHNENTVKTKTDEIIKMPNRPKKRILSSSSEDSSTDDDDDDDTEEGEDAENEANTKLKQSKGGVPAEKRHKSGAGATTSANPSNSKKSHENGKKKKDQEQQQQQTPVITISVSSSNSPKPTTDELGSDSDMRQKTLVKTTTVKDMLKAKRDNFLKMQTVNGGGEVKGVAAKSSGDDDESSSDDSDDSAAAGSDSNQSAPQDKKIKKPALNAPGGEEKTSREEKLRATDTKLPELEADVVAGIMEFKEIVKSKNMTGKMFHFDERLTEIFLRIDESLLCIEKPQRNMVFAHLEFHLLLPKYFFLRKAKQLRIKEEKLKSNRALGKLRKAIIEAMPGAIADYEVELRKHASSNLNADHPPKMSKKKFPWTSNLRNLLYDVYQVRWTSYPVLGTRKEQLEDFINVYMRTKVTELWPNGWMRYEELQKEIEKRKVAAKKAKEKEKKKELGVGRGTTAAPTVGAITISATTTSTTTTPPQVVTPNSTTYIKQFEDFATSSSRSCANSDTDSVASSSGVGNICSSSGLKRKVTPDAAQKSSKMSKAATKINGEQQTKSQTTAAAAAAAGSVLDLISPSKRTDHSIHHIISNSEGSSPTPIANAAISPQQKHSMSAQTQASPPTAHVIDLDNYESTSDTAQTPKQLLNNAASSSSASGSGSTVNAAVKPDIRRESCSDSDGVEIVGYFPAKPLAAATAAVVGPAPLSKQRYKKNANTSSQSSRSATPNNNNLHSETAAAAAMATAGGNNAATMSTRTLPSLTTTSHSTANNSNNKKSALQLGGGNTKASSSPPATFDANQVVNVLKELEDLQQKQKHLASPQSASKKEPHQ